MASVNGSGVIPGRRIERSSRRAKKKLDRMVRLEQQSLCIGDCCAPVSAALDELARACGARVGCTEAVERVRAALAERTGDGRRGQ